MRHGLQIKYECMVSLEYPTYFKGSIGRAHDGQLMTEINYVFHQRYMYIYLGDPA
jgi:hypothetical protein